MNNQFGNQPPGPGLQTPPPGGPFEQPGQQPQPPPPAGFQPPGMQPPSPQPGGGKTWILIIILILILVVGGLVFASWQGWISLGGIEKLWKKTTTTVPETPTDTGKKANANDTQRKADLTQIKDALKNYFQANQSYPEAATVQKTLDQNSVLVGALVPTYIDKLPVDPLSPTYYYGYTSDGKTFSLTAVLEDKTDASGIKVGDILIYKVTDTSVETPTSSSSSSSSTNSSSNLESETTP